MALSLIEIGQLAWDAGFRGADLARAIAVALAESSGNPNARNTRGGNDARGLMQINVASRANPQYAGRNLYDPATNMKTAYELQKANGWAPWNSSRAGQILQSQVAARAAGVVAAQRGVQGVTEAADNAVEAAQGVSDGLSAVGPALSKTTKWITTPANWLRIAYVVAGIGLAIGGLLVIARPAVMPIVNAATGTTGTVTKAAKKVASVG